MQAGCLKIAPLSALLTSLKELSWSSSHEAQRWLDDGYQGESIPLSKQHLGVITPVTEKQEDLIFIIFLWGVSSSSWTNWFNTVKNWKGRVRYSGLWYCFNWWWETKERHHKDLNNQSQSFLQTTDTPEVDVSTKCSVSRPYYLLISWLSHQNVERTDANRDSCSLSRSSGYFYRHLKIFLSICGMKSRFFFQALCRHFHP